MAVTWTDPPLYIDPAIISAPEWNLALRDNQNFLHKFTAFRYYFGSFGGTGQPNATQDIKSTHGTATGGTFRLSYNGNFTSPLSYNASNLEVTEALKLLPGLAHASKFTTIANFTLYGTSLNTGFQIVFDTTRFTTTIQVLGKDDTLLTGDTITITVEGITGDKIPLILQNDPAIPTGQGSPTDMEPGVWWFNANLAVPSFTSNLNLWIVVSGIAIAHTFIGASGSATRAYTMKGYGIIKEGDTVGVYSDSGFSPIQGAASSWFEGSWQGA